MNNPVNMEDPTGYIAWWIIGGIAGAVVGGIAGAVYSYKKTGSVDWRYVAGGAVAGGLVGAGLGYLAQGAYAAIVGTAATVRSVSANNVVNNVNKVSKAQQVVSNTLNIEKGINFTNTTAKHMDNPARHVPVQILKEAIKHGTAMNDPRGSDALMYYINMYRNGSKFNLEVLYDSTTNTIYHFEYARKAMGPLVEIFKK